MPGNFTASAIASASMASFLFDLSIRPHELCRKYEYLVSLVTQFGGEAAPTPSHLQNVAVPRDRAVKHRIDKESK